MRRAPPMQFVPLNEADMPPAEIPREIARLAGLYVEACGAAQTVAMLLNIVRALQPGGRA